MASSIEEMIAAVLAGVTRPGDAMPALLDALGHARKPVQRRAAEAVATLAAQGEAVRPHLLAAMADDHPRRPWGAVYALSLLGEPPVACLPILLDTMGDGDGDLRWAAATIVLGMRNCGLRGSALVDLAARGNSAQRKMALYCLRDLGGDGEAAIAAGERALADPEPLVRHAGLAVLTALASDRTRLAERMADLVRDPDPGVRRAAAAALGRMPGTVVVRAVLSEALGAADPSLVRAASQALARLGRD